MGEILCRRFLLRRRFCGHLVMHLRDDMRTCAKEFIVPEVRCVRDR